VPIGAAAVASASAPYLGLEPRVGHGKEGTASSCVSYPTAPGGASPCRASRTLPAASLRSIAARWAALAVSAMGRHACLAGERLRGASGGYAWARASNCHCGIPLLTTAASHTAPGPSRIETPFKQHKGAVDKGSPDRGSKPQERFVYGLRSRFRRPGEGAPTCGRSGQEIPPGCRVRAFPTPHQAAGAILHGLFVADWLSTPNHQG